MGLSQTSAPADEPLSQAQAKVQLRIDSSNSDHDTDIDDAIVDARTDLENWTERQLITATWTWKLDGFPIGSSPFTVPYPPLQSITSITYIDEDGDTQTLASSKYDVDNYSQPGRIALASEQVWPDTQSGVIDVVTIAFVAGYGTSETAMPGNVLRAMRLLVQDYFDFRDPKQDGRIATNPTLQRILWGLRIEVGVS